jgi:hypothetical protein
MHKVFFLLPFLLITLAAKANDGAFYAVGNQLIPILETDISVKKEILRITRINETDIKVEVDYEFYNPVDEKKIIVGFEAPSPVGDVDGTPKNGKHPYIKGFTVNINGAFINYQTAIVTGTNYVKSNKIESQQIEDVIGENFNPNAPDFYYVNYFDATFKKGINKIRHEYIFRISGSIETEFSFNYILTAANRWANNKIDDFTLIIDMGKWQNYTINQTFFNNKADWTTDGVLIDGKVSDFFPEKNVSVFSKNQALVFKQMNFHPKGELEVYKRRDFKLFQIKQFNLKEHQLPYSVDDFFHIQKAVNHNSFKVLRNLLYARRGYIFKTEFIQRYYESMDWYVPNPDYKINSNEFTTKETEWLKELKSNP